MCFPSVRDGIVVTSIKTKINKNVFRKQKPHPESELDAWPRNPKSWGFFQGHCQDQPQAKAKKVRFSKETEYFWSHRRAFFGNLFAGYYKKYGCSWTGDFLKNVVCQCPCYISQRQINRGAINCKSGMFVLRRNDDILVGQGARAPWSAQGEDKLNGQKEVTTTTAHSAAPAYSLCGAQNPFILFQKQ